MADIWARQAGEGEDVLLVSGLGDDHAVWGEAFDLLAASHRVVSFDNRGIGRSPLGPEDFTLAEMARDALDVIDAMGVETAHVVGSSMGGAISQELVLMEPERVRTLALVGTWGRYDEHLARLLRHHAELPRLIEDPRHLQEAICLWVYSGAAHMDGTVEALIEAALADEGPGQTEEAFARTAEVAIGHDPGERLRAIDVPTLVAVGEEDRIVPLRLSRGLVDLISGSRLEVLPERGHQPFQEDAAGFVEMLRRFWDEHRAAD
ncbi:MAG: alpha/beta fold hydrolase [Actinobacteria bacterium]|nr:alpha/beta fold hydrolase [Actinomycetota bacterium]